MPCRAADRAPECPFYPQDSAPELYKPPWPHNARQLFPNADAGPEGWASRDKFAAVLETAVLNEADLAEYYRQRGLFAEQIKTWRLACEQANDWDRTSAARMCQATREEKKRIKVLESTPKIKGLR